MPAARGRADRAAILLRAGNPVRKTIVGGDMIDLRGGLVVPGTPRDGAIHRNDSALIAAEDHALRIVRINPELMIIVATRRALDRGPGPTQVCRSIDRSVGNVNQVGIFRIDCNLFKVPTAVPNTLVARSLDPFSAGIIGNKEAALFGIDDGVHAIMIRRRHGDSDMTATLERDAFGNFFPARAAVQ